MEDCWLTGGGEHELEVILDEEECLLTGGGVIVIEEGMSNPELTDGGLLGFIEGVVSDTTGGIHEVEGCKLAGSGLLNETMA